MKMNLFWLLAFQCLQLAQAAPQFASVKLIPSFSYQDTDRSCVVSHSESHFLYFNALLEDGVVKEARLRDIGLTFPHEIVFSDEELKGIGMELDAVGEYRLVALPLNARLLNWVIFNIDSGEVPGYLFCQPPKKLATLKPNSHLFRFTLKNASDLFAATQRFKGERSDGAPYSVKLGFLQKPVE